MGKQRTRPYDHANAGAPSLAEAEILFSDAVQDIVAVPEGAVVTRVWAQVLEVFNASLTNVLVVGHAAVNDAYMAAADINEAAVGVSAARGPFAAEAVARTIQARFTQTGTAATTGRARVFVEYVRLADNG